MLEKVRMFLVYCLQDLALAKCLAREATSYFLANHDDIALNSHP